MQGGVLELVGEQAKPRYVRCPAPAGRAELQKRYLDGVARFCAVNIDRACHRIDLAEIQFAEVSEGRFGGDLPAGGIRGIECNGLAGRDPDCRGIGIVPAVVAGVIMDCVGAFHGYDVHPNMAGMSIVARPLQVLNGRDSFPCLR